jgi:hypothetical protein
VATRSFPGWTVVGSFKFGDYFSTVNLSFRTFLLSFCRVIFVSFGHFCSEFTLWNCFWHWYISDHTGLYFLTLLLIFLNHLLYSRVRALFTRLIPWLPSRKLGVYCILHTLVVSWTGLGCQFRTLLYLYQFNPCGEVCAAFPRGIVLCSLWPRLLWILRITSLEFGVDFLFICVCSHCKDGQSVDVYMGFDDNEFWGSFWCACWCQWPEGLTCSWR